MIDEYTKNKIKELDRLIDVISWRQKEINKELSGDFNREYKNLIGQESQHNSTALRIMFWIKKVLKGESFEKRLKSDKNYPLWMFHTISCEIRDILAKELKLSHDDYKHKYWYGEYYTGMNQWGVYHRIYDYLFPEKQSGIFGFCSEEDIQNEVWRTTFKELPQKEWQRFKEMRGH